MVFLGPERRHQGGSGVHVPSSVFCIPMHPAPAHRCKRLGSAERRLPVGLLPQRLPSLRTHHLHKGTRLCLFRESCLSIHCRLAVCRVLLTITYGYYISLEMHRV